MKRQLAATVLVGALALLVLVARPASAHDDGVNHWDGPVYHDYRYGGHVDRYYSPYGDEYDRVYRRPANPYRYDYYGYGRGDRYRDDDCDHSGAISVRRRSGAGALRRSGPQSCRSVPIQCRSA